MANVNNSVMLDITSEKKQKRGPLYGALRRDPSKKGTSGAPKLQKRALSRCPQRGGPQEGASKRAAIVLSMF